MKLIRVGAAILNQTPLDWDGNQRRIRGAIAAAREQGVSILCLPELCITGYGCEDAFHAVGTQNYALQVLGELLPETRGMIVSFGVPLLYGSGLYNTSCLAADGKLLGFVGKQNLAGEGIHYEPRWFKRWPADAQVMTRVMGKEVPLGDLIFECGGVRLGQHDVYLSIAGGLRIFEPAADLAAAAALVSSLTGAVLPADCVFFGEIGLSGAVRPVIHTGLRLKEAAKLGFRNAILPPPPGEKAEDPPPEMRLRPSNHISKLVADIASLAPRANPDPGIACITAEDIHLDAAARRAKLCYSGQARRVRVPPHHDGAGLAQTKLSDGAANLADRVPEAWAHRAVVSEASAQDQ
mgnify:CR=1 FL=1